MAQGITYSPCPKGCGVVVILKDIMFRAFNYAEQNWYLKIFIGYVVGNDGPGGGGLFTLKSLLTLKKGFITSDFKSNEHQLKSIKTAVH